MTDVRARSVEDTATLALREHCQTALVKLDEFSARLAEISVSQTESPVIPLLRQSIAHLQKAAKSLERLQP